MRRTAARWIIAAHLGAWLAPSSATADPLIEEHPARLIVEAPSEALVNEPVRITLLLGTRWGREGPAVPSAGVDWGAPLDLLCTDADAKHPAAITLSRDARGRASVGVTFATPGLHRIEVTGENGLSGWSNPIRVLASEPEAWVLWGDLQAHLHTPGAGHAGALSPEEYRKTAREALDFARDVSNLDFCAITPHIQTAGGLARPGPDGVSPWSVLSDEVERANADSNLVVFPGYEWQGREGDHCVILPERGRLAAPSDFLALADTVAARGALLSAHAVFLPTTFQPYTPVLAAVEVTRDSKSTEELGLEAIRNGLVPAFLGCSDTHGGAIGATSLTGLRATAKTREAVREAVAAGRTWATNGERIVVDFEVDDSGPIPRLTVRGVATASVDAIEVFRNTELVARARGFGSDLTFDFSWEDEDLLRADCVAGPVVYHAKITQVSVNRYDASRRDFAITSPIAIGITAGMWNESYRRMGAGGEPTLGDALTRLSEAWNVLRVAPARPLRAPLPAELPAWPAEAVGSLQAAVDALVALAAADSTLLPLSRDLAPLGAIADALARVREAEALIGTGADRVTWLASARRANEAAAAAQAAGARTRWDELRGAWSGATEFAGRAEAALRLAEATPERRPAPVIRNAGAVSSLRLPEDPRIWASLWPVTERSQELHESFEARQGYTETAPLAAADEIALVVRVVADGVPGSGLLTSRAGGWSIPLESGRRGWTARVPRGFLPAAGAAPPLLLFEPPAKVASVHLEDGLGHPLPPLPQLRAFGFRREGEAARAHFSIEGGSLSADLALELERGPPRTLWGGILPPGDHDRAFGVPGDVEATAVLRWGRVGWRRVAAVELPGHDAARPGGLAALPDGRAAVALSSGLVLVNPLLAEIRHVAWPEGHGHETGREFCVAPLPDGRVLVRAADGPIGGWARVLDPASGQWSDAPAGPESGTVVADADGGLAWLTGRTLHRRNTAGQLLDELTLDRTGRLLGFDPSGHPVVRLADGSVARLSPVTGAVASTLPGPILAMEPSGAVIRLAGLDARAAEHALGVDLELVLADGTPLPVSRLPFRPLSRHDGPAVLAAVTPDGSLLLLGGTTWWRRAPGHDWWGAVLERWEPVWAGERRAS